MLENTTSLPSLLLIRTREAFVRGVIWAFIGTFYGVLFTIFSVLAEEWQLPLIHPFLFAGVLAATIGALIYSSMRLAVLIAIIISPVCAILMLFSDQTISPFNLLLIISLVGAIAGGVYGRFNSNSRVYRADAKTLTGFTAGLMVSVVGLFIDRLFPAMPIGVVIGIMCPLTGLVYVYLVPSFIRRFDNLLSSAGDGALVGIGVAVFLTLCNFVMVHSVDIDSTGAFHSLVHHVQYLLPQAILGGMLGGSLAGVFSSLLFDNWQDL